MNLEDLTGRRELSGLDTTTIIRDSYGLKEECSAVRFILDGTTYVAIEDPEDGYRSYMREIAVADEADDPITNTFPPHAVFGRMDDRESDKILEFTDLHTGAIVLRLGTYDYDDYYPCCIMDWRPQNLWVNAQLVGGAGE